MQKGQGCTNIDSARGLPYTALLIDKYDNSSHATFPTYFTDSIISVKVQLYRCCGNLARGNRDCRLHHTMADSVRSIDFNIEESGNLLDPRATDR